METLIALFVFLALFLIFLYCSAYCLDQAMDPSRINKYKLTAHIVGWITSLLALCYALDAMKQ